jgi:hypothetical protein
LNEMKFERDLEVKKLEEFLEKLGYVKWVNQSHNFRGV